MTTTTIRRTMIFLIVIGMTLAGTVVPAFAVATGSASLADDVFFAGSNATLDVTVTNNAAQEGIPVLEPEGSHIDAVQILVDTDVVSPVNPPAPPGWTGDYNEARGTAYYYAKSDADRIAPGGSLTFSLPTAVEPRSGDASSSVIVQVSDDRGDTSTNAGVLGFDIKVLEVLENSVTIVKPVTTQAANLVTEQQETADIQLRVANHANVDKSVTAAASKDGGSSSFDTYDDPDDPTDVAEELIPAGGEHTFNLSARFGAPGSLSILGQATAANAEAVTDTFEDVTVQQAIALAYNNDLDPLAAVPGGPETFTLSVAKTGGPGGTLDTTFTIRDGVENPSDSASLPVGANSDTGTLSYTVDIPLSILDGEHPSDLVFSGTDQNGAVVPEVTLDLDDILLDRLLPILNLTLTPPASAVTGADPAAGAGDSVGVSGTVERQDDSGTRSPCGECDVLNEVITFLDGAGAPTGTQAGPDLTTDSSGNISGSFTMPTDVPGGTVTVKLSADAVRAPNLPVAPGSGSTDVDIVAPLGVDEEIAGEGFESVDGSLVTTGRDADGDFIDVPFSELVGFGALAGAQDWGVEGNVVESLEYVDGSAAGTGKVRLRLAQPIDRNGTPRVTYTPAFPVQARAFDRVELSLADQAMEAIDNIAPDVLGIVSVSTYRGYTEGNTAPPADGNGERVDQGSFGGVFYTRDRTPVVTVNNVQVGDTVRVFNDLDGDGVQTGGETTLGTLGAAQSETPEVTLLDLGATERTLNISAYAIDAGGNSGLGSTDDQLSLDFVSPSIVDFTRSGSTITVNFDEAVPVGRDAAFDWLVLSDGRWRPVDAVTNGDGDDTTRALNINAAVVPGEVDAVRWESVTTDTGDDYADIARNEANPTGLQYTK